MRNMTEDEILVILKDKLDAFIKKGFELGTGLERPHLDEIILRVVNELIDKAIQTMKKESADIFITHSHHTEPG